MPEVFLLVQKKRNNRPILYHLDQLWQNKLQKLFHGSMLMSQQLCKPMIKQGPLITDGQNSSKWTGHYVGWSKTLQMVQISEQNF